MVEETLGLGHSTRPPQRARATPGMVETAYVKWPLMTDLQECSCLCLIRSRLLDDSPEGAITSHRCQQTLVTG